MTQREELGHRLRARAHAERVAGEVQQRGHGGAKERALPGVMSVPTVSWVA
ncbi:hypothetical protein [Nonomuraea sp. NPDC049400]|uniref:hypothetical protein n=1 Tax=Nonomuraea sp. NPDC049400 TaxID=3364352 RepID=UPI0037B305EE